MTIESERAAEQAAEDFHRRHHHDHSKDREIVLRNYPQASAAHNTRLDGIEEWWIINNANGNVLSEVGVGFATEAAAWDNALFKLKQLNALLLWRAAGEPMFIAEKTLEFWLDSQGNLEDEAPASVPPPTD